jgi:hypothetical protein
MNGRTVLLYGRSLLMSGVAASLEHCTGLRILRATTWSEASRLMSEQRPDVFIFDLTNATESDIFALLVANPTLLIIGLDPECNRAVLVSGHEAQSLTVTQIAEMALREDAAS